MSDRSSGETLLVFVLGGLVGACLGVLFAPQKGKDTRRKLKALVEEIGEKAEDLIEEGKEKYGEIISKSASSPSRK
jgi:gas vesicle protein